LTSYLIHKAVEFSAVKVSVRNTWGVKTVDELSNRFIAQRKYDGCNVVVIVTPNGEGDRVLSRTGEVVKSCQHFIAEVRRKLSSQFVRGQGFAVLGEAWRAGVTQAVISGDFRRSHPIEPRLRLMVFDMLTVKEFEAGQCDWMFTERHDFLHRFFRDANVHDYVQLCPTYNPGTYGPAQRMADELCKGGGFDGLILRQPDGLWAAGSGTGGEIVKVKPVQSYDLLVVGLEEGKGKYVGTLGALVCKGPKGLVKVSGMSDEQRRVWWSASNPDAAVIGRIIEVQCLGLTAAGSFREPRFKGIRFDKEAPDFD
jgi:ATP-dependent DNA ligase